MTIPHSLLLLAQAASPAASPAGGQPLSPIQQLLSTSMFPVLVVMGLFLFLTFRSQQKKTKEHQTLISSLKTGDKVVTTGGIHGLISNVKDQTVIVKVADNVKIEVDKAAVATVFKRQEAEASAS
jgi:preprotein translocase subunit YajC